jgi:hypothetical protein
LWVLRENHSAAAYEQSKTTATPTDSVFRSAENSTARAVGSGKPPPETSWKMAGMIKATAARRSIRDCADAARASKNCRSRRSPPASIDTPITSKMLPKIDPTTDAFTTSCNPAPSANNAMINSGAFPNVTFRNPPMPGPERAASSSVARPMRAAVGMTPSADAAKIGTGSAWTSSSTIATGISGTSRYGQPSPDNRKERFVAASGVCVVNFGLLEVESRPRSSRGHPAPDGSSQSSRLRRTYCMMQPWRK